MQSATSFFNRALFRKNLQRFWPLWLGYVLIWLLLLPLPLLNELADYHGVPIVADASYYLLQIGAYGGLVMGAVFGIFFAMAMFAYLTNPRATQGFHSMPVRRETLYATNYLTGLVCMVSALVLAFALAGITAACFGALNLTALGTALLAAVLSVLFFYSFAVLCMMFTGQILAAPCSTAPSISLPWVWNTSCAPLPATSSTATAVIPLRRPSPSSRLPGSLSACWT